MTQPLISILMPCYNAEDYVGAAIESALAQTWPNKEIIVVDDGSADSSVSVIRRYIPQGIHLITQMNSGASAARNKAYAASQGEFVLFFDADDVIAPAHIESLYASLQGAHDSIAMSEWDRFYHTPAEARFPARQSYRTQPGVDWLLHEWATTRPMTQPGMFLIPRAILERVGGWDEQLSLNDDFEFYARVLLAAAEVIYSPKARLYYRSMLANSLSRQKTRKAVASAFLSFCLGAEHVLAVRNDQHTRHVCANLFQAFDFQYYPNHADLRQQARAKVRELGGATIAPDGPPGFHRLRPYLGWRLARHMQHAAQWLGVNGAARQHRKRLIFQTAHENK